MFESSHHTLIILIIILSCVIPIAVFILTEFQAQQKRKIIDETLEKLSEESLELTPEEFMELREQKIYGRKYEGYYSLTHNFAGIYILHNVTKDKYYVGQSKTVLNRVNMHFTGKGNGDVYFDYRSGDSFTIKMISLEKSGFSDLNSLERNAIAKYNAYYNGYNKTRGNY